MFTAIFIAFAVLVSCQSPDEHLNDWEDSSSILKLTVNVQGLGTDIATRVSVDPEDGEEALSSLYLLFFEYSSDMSGAYVDYIEVTGTLSMNTQITLSIPVGSNINTTSAYNILAIGNIGNNNYITTTFNSWATSWSGYTEAYVREQATAYLNSSTSLNKNVISPSNLLMNGTTTKAANSGTVSVTLTRNMVRLDVVNTALRSDYDLVSATIWNAYPKSSISGDGVFDYSSGTRRIRTLYSIDNTSNTETDTDTGETYLKNIIGGLYTFENRVTSPAQGDAVTTCLIIGLRNRTTDVTGYYRVNVHPTSSSQNLRRNNVYRVTITAVAGSGASTEEEAYAGIKNELVYTINNWDLDDNGLIVADTNSIIAVPVKTAKFDAEGGTNSYTIVTLSNLTDPGTLQIKSQEYSTTGNEISASLTGNNLIVTASALSYMGEERSGIITITFAGLEASVNVFQSGSVGMYLSVALPDGWTGSFASSYGISSDWLTVKASGTWTAKLIGEGFTFGSSPYPATQVTQITSSDVSNDKFKVYTYSTNSSDTAKEAFVVISLDDDPVNYASVVILTQKPAGSIAVSPTQSSVQFDGMMNPVSSNATFDVTALDFDGNDLAWTYMMMPNTTNDDSDKFALSVTNNTFIVSATQQNDSGRDYAVTLRVFLAGDSSKYYDIPLLQTSNSITLSPNVITAAVDVAGGESDYVIVSSNSSTLTWTATVSTYSTTTGSVLTNHEAYIVDESGNEITSAQAVGSKFKVVFPKVYYPNRERGIEALVTINVTGSTLSETITVKQNPLTSQGVNAWVTASGYGTIGGTDGYFSAFRNAFTYDTRTYTSTGTALSSSFSFVNLNYADTYSPLGTAATWTTLNNWVDSDNGVLLITGDYGPSYTAVLTQLNTNSVFADAGFNFKNTTNSLGGSTAATGSILNTDSSVTGNRVYQYIMTYAPYAGSVTSTPLYFYTDTSRTEVSAWSDTSTPIIMVNNGTGNALLIIDPKNNTVFLGDGEIFGTTATQTGYSNRYYFMLNLQDYIYNAARYGSHFTDMLVDYASTSDACYVEAPWDSVWGVNAMQ